MFLLYQMLRGYQAIVWFNCFVVKIITFLAMKILAAISSALHFGMRPSMQVGEVSLEEALCGARNTSSKTCSCKECEVKQDARPGGRLIYEDAQFSPCCRYVFFCHCYIGLWLQPEEAAVSQRSGVRFPLRARSGHSFEFLVEAIALLNFGIHTNT